MTDPKDFAEKLDELERLMSEHKAASTKARKGYQNALWSLAPELIYYARLGLSAEQANLGTASEVINALGETVDD